MAYYVLRLKNATHFIDKIELRKISLRVKSIGKLTIKI